MVSHWAETYAVEFFETIQYYLIEFILGLIELLRSPITLGTSDVIRKRKPIKLRRHTRPISMTTSTRSDKSRYLYILLCIGAQVRGSLLSSMAPWRCERHTVICRISAGYLLPVHSLHCDISETGSKIPH